MAGAITTSMSIACLERGKSGWPFVEVSLPLPLKYKQTSSFPICELHWLENN